MRTGRPPNTRARILRALAACTDPLGASHAWLVENTRVKPKCLASVIYKMARAEIVYAVAGYKMSRYFLTEATRDAARPAVEAHFAAVKAESHRLATEARRARDRDRGRRAETLERRRARRAAQRAMKPPKAPKPAKVVQPKAAVHPARAANPSRVHIVIAKPRAPRKPGGPKWEDLPATIPPGVRVQKLPGCPHQSRYAPPPSFRGEWQAMGIGHYLAAQPKEIA